VDAFYSGDGVSIYGPVDADLAPFTASLDGGPSTIYSLLSDHTLRLPQTIIYHATNLGGGEHQVKLGYAPGGLGDKTLSIDFANVYTTIEQPGANPATGSTSFFSTGSTIGITLGVCITTLLLGLILFIFIHWQRETSKVTSVSVFSAAENAIQVPYTHPLLYDAETTTTSANSMSQMQRLWRLGGMVGDTSNGLLVCVPCITSTEIESVLC
jgi:hypothetical protein